MKNVIKTELIPSQMKDVLRDLIRQNEVLAAQGKMPIAYNIEGAAGISKTSICKQIATEFDHHFVRLNVAELEASDIIGYPLVQYELCKKPKGDEEGECLWISEKLINNYLLLGYEATNESRMTFSKPEWIQGKEDKPVLLLLDDYSRALPMVIQACMRILDEQHYASWSLPQGSTVVLTTNPGGNDYLVTEMDEAQTSRYISFKMKPSVDDWALWAEGNGVDTRMINYLLKHPDIIQGSMIEKDNGEKVKRGNLRSWTKFFDAISGYANLEDHWDKIFWIGQNSLPVEDLILLNKFIEDKLDKIMGVEDMLKLDIRHVVTELTELVGKGSKKRTDLSAIISKRLLNYALVNHKSFTPKMIENYGILLQSDIVKPDLVLLSLAKVCGLLPALVKIPGLQDKLIGR